MIIFYKTMQYSSVCRRWRNYWTVEYMEIGNVAFVEIDVCERMNCLFDVATDLALYTCGTQR